MHGRDDEPALQAAQLAKQRRADRGVPREGVGHLRGVVGTVKGQRLVRVQVEVDLEDGLALACRRVCKRAQAGAGDVLVLARCGRAEERARVAREVALAGHLSDCPADRAVRLLLRDPRPQHGDDAELAKGVLTRHERHRVVEELHADRACQLLAEVVLARGHARPVFGYTVVLYGNWQSTSP